MRIAVLWATIAVCLALIVFAWNTGDSSLSRYGGIGTTDFIQYWSAHKLAARGENFYDPQLLYAIEAAQGLQGEIPILMWNPPWLLALMYPVLQFDFLTSAAIWALINLAFMVGSGLLFVSAYRGRLMMSPAILVSMFLYVPHISTLWFGQLGLLYCMGISLFLFAVRHEDDRLTALALIPLTVKPHLVYLVLILLGYWIVVQRKWRLVATFTVFFGALVTATQLLYPRALGYWVAAFGRPPTYWKVGTLVGMSREVIYLLTDQVVDWPIVIIPAMSAASLLAWLWFRRPQPDLLENLPWLLGLSLFTSPYGWLFDQSQLVVVQVGLVALADRSSCPLETRHHVWMVLVAVQLLITLQQIVGFSSHHHFFWTSLAAGLVWIYCRRLPGMRATPIAASE